MKHLQYMAFVFLSACICAVMSERIFWFWSPGIGAHLEVSVYYALPVAFTLWAMATYRVSSMWSVLLATPLYAYVTEGVITPVMYTGGPLIPFFPAWFSFWHGAMAFGLVLLAIRWWLVVEAWKPLTGAAVGLGLFWGVWSSTLRLPENANDAELVEDLGGALTVLGPAAFARYTMLFTAVLMLAHWLLGFVWPHSYTPGRIHKVTVGGLVLAGATMWTVAVLWALPMFLTYVALQRWGLRRHAASADGCDIFARLHGRVRIRALLPLVVIAPTAAGTYATVWKLDPSPTALQVIFYGVIAMQTIAGAGLTITALRRVRSIPSASPAKSVGDCITLARRSGSRRQSRRAAEVA